jgi:hypothetical protein
VEVRIAVVLDGEVHDLSPDDAQRLIETRPDIRREWVRWSRLGSPQGRLILLDQGLVGSVLAENVKADLTSV